MWKIWNETGNSLRYKGKKKKLNTKKSYQAKVVILLTRSLSHIDWESRAVDYPGHPTHKSIRVSTGIIGAQVTVLSIFCLVHANLFYILYE